MTSTNPAHVYKVRPRKDHRGVDLISDALPFGRLWYGEPNAISNAIGYATHRSRSHHAVIRVYDAAGNVIETHEHRGDFFEEPFVKSRNLMTILNHAIPSAANVGSSINLPGQ